MTILEMLEWCNKAKEWHEVNFESFQHLQSLELLHKAIVQTQPVGSSLVECDLVYFLLRMAWNNTEHWLADFGRKPEGDQYVVVPREITNSEVFNKWLDDHNRNPQDNESWLYEGRVWVYSEEYKRWVEQPDARNQASELMSPCPEQQAAFQPMPKASQATQSQEESSEDVLIAEKWLQIWENEKPGRRFSGLGGIHAWENDVLVASGDDVVGLMLELSLME